MRDTFIKTIERCAATEQNIVFLTADLGFKLFDSFKKTFPGRFFNMGVAECNMIGVAAGLAMTGKIVYCYSIAPFITLRTLEQIKLDVCFNRLNVRLLGIGGGLAYGIEGVTHHAPEDFAILRPIPNIAIVAPGDKSESRQLAEFSVSHQGPLYIRLTKENVTNIHERPEPITFGRANPVRKGKDCLLIATGQILGNAAQACDILHDNGIDAGLVSMHTIKPLDTEFIRGAASGYRAILTIEEHSVIGGLGSAVADVLVEHPSPVRMCRIGIPDSFNTCGGDVPYLRQLAGLTPSAIADRVRRFLEEQP